MRIDSHNHFWRYDRKDYGWIEEGAPIARDFLPGNLGPHLKAHEIAGSIAVQARQSEEETSWLLSLANDNSNNILGVVGWINLRDPALEAALNKFSHDFKLKGFRHVIQDEPQDDFMLQPQFIKGVQTVLARGYVYDILIFARQAENVPEFLERAGNGLFVLDHIAKPDIRGGEIAKWASSIKAIARFPNVYCKLSGIITEADHQNWSPEEIEPYLDCVFEAFGPDRLLYGSDWPVCLLAGAYDSVFELVAEYVQKNCPESLDAILGANAAKVYAIDRFAGRLA